MTKIMSVGLEELHDMEQESYGLLKETGWSTQVFTQWTYLGTTSLGTPELGQHGWSIITPNLFVPNPTRIGPNHFCLHK